MLPPTPAQKPLPIKKEIKKEINWDTIAEEANKSVSEIDWDTVISETEPKEKK
jgi:hypothetical protein